MRISGSDLPQPISSGGQPKAPRTAAEESANYQTADLLAISAAASAASSNAERVDQLKLQVDSGEYFPSSVGIAHQLITHALARAY
jgi:anti-sigma28 factor (negative regulator of flagellin synthesis)